MARGNRKNHLTLIQGGASALGPVSRMGLWDRVPQVSKRHVYLWVAAKVVLIASLVYYFAS